MNRYRLFPPLVATVLIGALALTACSSQRPTLQPSGTSGKENARISLDTAYELLGEGQLIEALVDYRRVMNTSPSDSPEYRQALAGIVLVHIAPGKNPVYDTDKALNALDELHQSIAAASPPAAPEEGLLFTALRRTLEAELSAEAARRELEAARTANAELTKEKRQLEDALVKLRRLSLE